MKLSIVTINRNNAAGLARTLESTFAGQPGFDDWEQIVVDGASTDGSFAALDRWRGDPRLGWHVSEPDAGIYSAMNKGAAHARGDYLLFLNSGDELLPDALAAVFARPTGADIIYGDIVRDGDGTVYPFPVGDPDEINPSYFLFTTLPHQACFISRRLHCDVGGYDESLRIASDWKFFLECSMRPSVRFERVRLDVARFRMDGVSNDIAYAAAKRRELEQVLAPVFGRFVAHRAVYPPELRPWIREEDARAADADRELAKCMRKVSRGVAGLWRYHFFRMALKGCCGLASSVRRLLRRRKPVSPVA